LHLQKQEPTSLETTLNGYTEQTRKNRCFSWSLLTSMVNQIHVPVIAEGHISTPEEQDELSRSVRGASLSDRPLPAPALLLLISFVA